MHVEPGADDLAVAAGRERAVHVGVEQQQQLVDELLLEDVREGGAEGVDERQALVGCDLADLDHAVESTRTAYG